MFFHKIVYTKCQYCRFCVDTSGNSILCPICGGDLSSPNDIIKKNKA